MESGIYLLERERLAVGLRLKSKTEGSWTYVRRSGPDRAIRNQITARPVTSRRTTTKRRNDFFLTILNFLSIVHTVLLLAQEHSK